MKKVIIYLIFTTFFYIGCKDEPTKHEELPSGYQQDIPWPSLADSPWPMNHHDPQSTGRSRFLGPQLGVIAGLVPCKSMESGVAIGLNSIVYSNSRWELLAFNYDGEIKWSDTVGIEIITVPLVLADGTLISSDGLYSLLAINPEGTVKWKYTTDTRIRLVSVNVDKQGNLYFLENSKPGTLHVLNHEGILQWKLTDNRFYSENDCAPVFSPDGNILYIQGTTVNVLAVNIHSRRVEWTFGSTELRTSPILDSQGNIYIYQTHQTNGKNYFYSLKPDGQVRWVFEYYGFPIVMDNLEPTIDKNGNLYFGYDTLYSLTHQGILRWKKGFEVGHIFSPIISDVENNIYVGLGSGYYNLIKCFSDSGEEKFSVEITGERLLGLSPALTETGIMFYPTFRAKNIILIK